MSDPKKPNNARLGLVLAAVALFFFASVFIKRIWLS
ncbi:MAG: cytochrome oxidase small assembly protein [Pseudomonadota bacterium]|nr:cytochrome oxidase small assembly protein [Pseudomonadota bacterium]